MSSTCLKRVLRIAAGCSKADDHKNLLTRDYESCRAESCRWSEVVPMLSGKSPVLQDAACREQAPYSRLYPENIETMIELYVLLTGGTELDGEPLSAEGDTSFPSNGPVV